MINHNIVVNIAGLWLRLHGLKDGPGMTIPECHFPFKASVLPDTGDARMALHCVSEDFPHQKTWKKVFLDEHIWQICLTENGNFVYQPPKASLPLRKILIDPLFTRGKIFGAFPLVDTEGKSIYPLQGIEMVIFANWLARFGDFFTHASGISYQGEGYFFSGRSGIGKSTLATELTKVPGVTVLGEDSVIIRSQNGRFMLYGTPWHTNPERCAPGGVPLKKIFFIERDGTRHTAPCPPTAGINRLIQNSFLPYYNRPGMEHIMDTLPHLAEQVPFHTLSFQIGEDVIDLVRNA